MTVYFEKQNDRDCTIHSINNALGYKAVEKAQVLENISRLVEEFVRKADQTLSSPMAKKYRDMLASGNSFFSAEVVWDTAIRNGKVGSMMPVPGFGGDFAIVETLPSWVKEAPLVILGLDSYGQPHAIAARKGEIYDSQRCCDPIPLNTKNLEKVMNRVFTVFVVQPPERDGVPSQHHMTIVRTQPMAIERYISKSKSLH